MKTTEKRVRQLLHLARLLMLLTAAVVLAIIVVLSRAYGPAGAPAPALVAHEATDGPPPPGSYHRPATPAPTQP